MDKSMSDQKSVVSYHDDPVVESDAAVCFEGLSPAETKAIEKKRTCGPLE